MISENAVDSKSADCKEKPTLQPSGKWMSVKEMGDLLGIRKTDRYWLVHKQVFRTETMYGKMWVNTESFEKWYANQVKYRKVTGEEPGQELKEWSLSPQDIMHLLEIPEYRVYELIKEKGWEIVMVDGWMRITRKSFFRWYRGQKHYRTVQDRIRDRELEDATITFPQAAGMLGLTRQQFYLVMHNQRYSHFFDYVEVAGRRRVTKESFQRFLDGQDDYRIREIKEPETENGADQEKAGKDENIALEKDAISADKASTPFLTIAEAAQLAGVSRQLISRYAARGYFGNCRHGSKVRIPREVFTEWMNIRAEETRSDGDD